LIGVANTLSVYNALQVKNGVVDESAPLSRMLRETDLSTVETIIDRLDQWYAGNPGELDTPVLGVFWMGLVEAAQ
jgi:hypothetical protein